ITKWARTCYDTRRLGEFVATALRYATSGRMGPAFLDIPLDVQLNVAPNDVQPPRDYRTAGKPLGDPDLVKEAARLLREAERPIVLAGAGVRWSGAHEALTELAHDLKAPVFLNSLGRGCLSPDHPYFFSATRRFALGKSDLVLALGVDWDFRLGFGQKGFAPDAKVIQVDVDGVHVGRNRPVDVGIVGDPGRVIEQLVNAGAGNAEEPSWTEEVRTEEGRLLDEAVPGMESDAVPIHPQRFARDIRDFLDPDAVV